MIDQSIIYCDVPRDIWYSGHSRVTCGFLRDLFFVSGYLLSHFSPFSLHTHVLTCGLEMALIIAVSFLCISRYRCPLKELPINVIYSMPVLSFKSCRSSWCLASHHIFICFLLKYLWLNIFWQAWFYYLLKDGIKAESYPTIKYLISLVENFGH